MSSITTAVAADYRLQQWAQLVKECQKVLPISRSR